MLDVGSYPFNSQYIDILGHKIHYVEAGEGAPVLFVHGNPTSSYLWRNVIPPVVANSGRRCIALDLLGLGKSDKPDDLKYTVQIHANIVAAFIDSLGLENIVLVADDWGGPLGMYSAVNRPELFEAAVLMETFLWTFTFEDDFDPKFRMPFRLMRGPLGFWFAQVMNMMTKVVIPEHCPITDEGLRYYLDSTPTVKSRRAIRSFVSLNPLHGKPAASVQFIENIRAKLPDLQMPVTWLKATPGVLPSDDYPPSLRKLEEMQSIIPNMEIKDFGPGHHFLAEEKPELVAEFIIEAIAAISQKQGIS